MRCTPDTTPALAEHHRVARGKIDDGSRCWSCCRPQPELRKSQARREYRPQRPVETDTARWSVSESTFHDRTKGKYHLHGGSRRKSGRRRRSEADIAKSHKPKSKEHRHRRRSERAVGLNAPLQGAMAVGTDAQGSGTEMTTEELCAVISTCLELDVTIASTDCGAILKAACSTLNIVENRDPRATAIYICQRLGISVICHHGGDDSADPIAIRRQQDGWKVGAVDVFAATRVPRQPTIQ